MEATGRDGGGGPSWSYRHEETGYTTSSSRSGTIVSTAYTSSASRLSSASSMESALLQLESQLGVGTSRIETDKKVQPIKKPSKENREVLKKKKLKQKHIESLVQEFFHASSENCSIEGGGGMKVLERWFSELGVRWVLLLHFADYASAWALGHPTIDEIWSWIRALTQIMETIRLTTSFFPDHGDDGFVGMPGISEEEEEEEEEEELPPESHKKDPLHFALFFQETMSKMLVFVDIMFSKSLSIRGPPYTSDSLVTRLYVYGALSRALSGIRLQLQFHPPPSVEVEKIEKETESLLLAKQGKAFEDIWSTLEETRTRVLKSMEEYSPGTRTPQGSSDIHDVTYSVMSHIFFLLDNHYTVTPLVSQAVSLGKHVPQIGEAPPLTSLIMEMVSGLEEKFITMSRLFLDKGLRFLFLLNNSNFIRKRLKGPFIPFVNVDVAAVTRKVEHYIESYMQVSWVPMLSLFNPTPLCFRRKYSPSSKFESEFQKTYTTQKLWKVPDPMLRKRLRKAVIEKIIPGYTKYIEDSKVTNTKFTPHELEEMLQELFEG